MLKPWQLATATAWDLHAAGPCEVCATHVHTYRPLTEDEKRFLDHVCRWGSDGYGVRKCGSKHWTWDFLSLGSPVVFPTKREAMASAERFHEVLLDLLRQEKHRREINT